MSLAGWTAALDGFEAALRAQEGVLSGRGGPSETFRPPDGLGPLPIELLPRALELARACADLTSELHVAHGRVRDGLRQLTQAETPTGPAFLSTHA